MKVVRAMQYMHWMTLGATVTMPVYHTEYSKRSSPLRVKPSRVEHLKSCINVCIQGGGLSDNGG